jgi:hypothetical protein
VAIVGPPPVLNEVAEASRALTEERLPSKRVTRREAEMSDFTVRTNNFVKF